MPMVKIWIHLVFSTKYRAPLITNQLKHDLLTHIRDNAKKKDIYIDTMNACSDHMHILLSLGNDQSIAKVAQLIKGESAHWVNENHLLDYKFIWQEEYYAASVSDSKKNVVRNYIKNQEEHHRLKTFEEECDMFIVSTP